MEGTFHAILQFITFGFGYGWPLHQEEGGINHNKREVKGGGGGGGGEMVTWVVGVSHCMYWIFTCQFLQRGQQGWDKGWNIDPLFRV